MLDGSTASTPMLRILPHVRRPCLLAFLVILSAGAANAQTFTPITSPCPLSGPCPDAANAFHGGQFGAALIVLDFDGDGAQDVAVGEPKRDCVYLFRGPNPAGATPIRIAASGPFAGCPPPPPTGDHFGAFLAKGDYDGAPGEELFIGAPKALGGRGEVHVLSRANPMFAMTSALPGVVGFGTSIAVADLDQDGLPDVAVGAPGTPRAGQSSVGSLHLFSSLLAQEVPLLNPAFVTGEAELGNYGAEMEVTDADGDGAPDLFVCASGNASGAQAFTGAVYLHRAPLVGPAAVLPQRIDDPTPLACEFGSRFGKAIDARDELLIVGAPRKEHLSASCGPNYMQQDPGGAIAFAGPNYSIGVHLPDRSPSQDGLFGFNVVLADVVGGPETDLLVISLTDKHLQLWDRGNFGAGPQILPMPAGSIYWALGTARGELDASNAKEEVLLGDPRAGSCAGRVLLLRF